MKDRVSVTSPWNAFGFAVLAAFLLVLTAPRVTYAATEYGVFFDGVDHLVEVTHNTALDPGTGDWTVEFWVKIDETAGTVGNTIYDFLVGKLETSNKGWQVSAQRNVCDSDEAGLNFALGNTSSTRVNTNADDFVCVEYGEWTYIAAVLDRTADEMKLSKNADNDWKTQTPPSGTIATSYPVMIGGDNTRDNYWTHGAIDEVRIWNVARTQEQIAANYTSELSSGTGLVARYGFNEGTGTAAADSVGTYGGRLEEPDWTAGNPFDTTVEVRTNAPTNVLATSATLNGSLEDLGGEASVDVYFKWGTDPDSLANTTSSTTLSATGTFSQAISGLTEDAVYYAQAYADGTSDDANGPLVSFGRSALSFDQDNDTVNMGDITELDGTTALTVEAWVKGTEYDNAIFISKHHENSDGSFYMAYDGDGNVRFVVINSSDVRVTHDVAYAVDPEWHHIAGVYDGAAETVAIYIDGVQVGSTSSHSGGLKATDYDLLIGDYFDLDWSWRGEIDEVRLWTVARTQEQIADNMYNELTSGTGLVGRWGFNEGYGALTEDSVGSNDGTVSGPGWTTGKLHDEVPTAPVLVGPADGGNSRVGPTLSATVSDPESDTLSVNIYGRDNFTPEDDFTVVMIPDTQYYSESYPATFASQTSWIADNVDDLNIQMVLHEGDVVDTGNDAGEWTSAMSALNTLSTNNIPNLISIGNHDYDDNAATRAATTFNSNIDYDTWYDAKSWFDGGAYAADSSENVYTKVTIGDLKYLFMTLEFVPRQAVVDWAEGIIAANSDHQVFIVTHAYMFHDDTRQSTGYTASKEAYGVGSDGHDGEELWDELAETYENIFFVASGHNLGDGLGQLSSTGDNGNTVHQVLSNYQHLSNGGNGWLRYYTFKPSEDKIYAYTYSPTLDEYNRTTDNQFTLDYDFSSSDDYTLLDTQSSVASGEMVSYLWNNYSVGTTQQWYVSTTDENSTTTGSTWSLTLTGGQTIPSSGGQGQNNQVAIDSVEVLQDGSAEVRWTTEGSVSYVNVYLSSDGGATWESVEHNHSNAGVYTLDTSDLVAQTYKLRVAATDLASEFSQDDISFTLTDDGSDPATLVSDDTVTDDAVPSITAHEYVLRGSEGSEVSLGDGALFRGQELSGVYLLRDGKRFVFPDERVFFSHYDSFDDVQMVSDDELYKVPFGGRVQFASGSLVKVTLDPRVYEVTEQGSLEHVVSESVARERFGEAWAKLVNDLSEVFWQDYQ